MSLTPKPFNYNEPHVYNFRAPGPIKPTKVLKQAIIKTPQESIKPITIQPKKKLTERTYTKTSYTSLRRKAEIIDPDAHVTFSCFPDEVIVKTWTCKNTGGQPWPAGLKLHYSALNSNARMECAEDKPHDLTLNNPEIPPGESYELEILLTAPSKPGIYNEVWQLSYEGKLIQGLIKVFVQVSNP